MVREKVVLVSGPRVNRIEVGRDEGNVYARRTIWITRTVLGGRFCVNNEKVFVSEGVKKGFARKAGVPAAP